MEGFTPSTENLEEQPPIVELEQPTPEKMEERAPVAKNMPKKVGLLRGLVTAGVLGLGVLSGESNVAKAEAPATQPTTQKAEARPEVQDIPIDPSQLHQVSVKLLEKVNHIRTEYEKVKKEKEKDQDKAAEKFLKKTFDEFERYWYDAVNNNPDAEMGLEDFRLIIREDFGMFRLLNQVVSEHHVDKHLAENMRGALETILNNSVTHAVYISERMKGKQLTDDWMKMIEAKIAETIQPKGQKYGEKGKEAPQEQQK